MNDKIKPVDKVFEFEGKPTHDFAFTKEVAQVFDDMVERSVPMYNEIQRMSVELACDFATENSNVFDIGCSTATTLALIDNQLKHKNVTLVGLDNSHDMLAKAKEKCAHISLQHTLKLEYADVNKGININNASVVMMLLTLQFVRPLRREHLVRQLYNGMNDNSALIMVEKVTTEDTMLNRLFIEHYYDYKRARGYSDLEISNKREALENVLIPYRMEENFDLLKICGFKSVEVFFRWYNFTGIIAIK